MKIRQATAHSQGRLGAIKPNTPAASSMENAVMPASSQPGRESTYAIAKPTQAAAMKRRRFTMKSLSN
jgi:hypothetical protein